MLWGCCRATAAFIKRFQNKWTGNGEDGNYGSTALGLELMQRRRYPGLLEPCYIGLWYCTPIVKYTGHYDGPNPKSRIFHHNCLLGPTNS